jgi:hypothetical protein
MSIKSQNIVQLVPLGHPEQPSGTISGASCLVGRDVRSTAEAEAMMHWRLVASLNRGLADADLLTVADAIDELECLQMHGQSPAIRSRCAAAIAAAQAAL